MTSVLNGNRFLNIAPLINKFLPRNVTCAGLKCRLYHCGEATNFPKSQCFNCWKSGHRDHQCTSEKLCRVCHGPGHEPGSEDCQHFKQTANVVAFQGKDNPISNFFPCEIKVFGEEHRLAEHAYQLTKALRAGNLYAAEKVRNAPTALDAKKVGTVKDPEGWNDQKLGLMEEILFAKSEQVPLLRENWKTLTTIQFLPS